MSILSQEGEIWFGETLAFANGAWEDPALRNIVVFEQEFEGEDWILNNQKRTVE
jgi:hypothetical protein